MSTSGKVDVSVPVVCMKLVPDHFGYGRLAAIRTLGRMGVPVHGLYADSSAADARSRYDRSTHALLRPGMGESEWLGTLMDLGSRLDRPVLLATDDVGALFVDEHSEELATRYRFPMRPKGLSQRLSNKGDLYRMCVDLGIPAPSTIFPTSRAEVEEYGAKASFPVVAKSMDPNLLQRRAQAASVAIAATATDLLDIYDRMEVPDEPNLMLQEYIPGDAKTVWMFNGYFDSTSRLQVGFTGRKIRQFAPGTGPTSLGICEHNSEVYELSRALLERSCYSGIVDMGWRYDVRDRTFKLLDVNPRMGATFRLFVSSTDLDVVRAMYLDLTGQDVPHGPPAEGRVWVNEMTDAQSVRRLRATGEASVLSALASTARAQERAWFARDDVQPFSTMMYGFARGAMNARRPRS